MAVPSPPPGGTCNESGPGREPKLSPLSPLPELARDACEDTVPWTTSIVWPICSICAESAVREVCKDVADRPWCTLW